MLFPLGHHLELDNIGVVLIHDAFSVNLEATGMYSYKLTHSDGRVSYPLCFIFSSPVGCKPEQQMMYAGSKNRLVQSAELTKVFEIRNADDLSEEWLKEKLSFFR
ncbi:hypothetical protein AMELA_G00098600 [Ameiurus melas]|uniref:Glia maturation factor n=1 Tax=Ameiurus melas TaxID=219545 RepID=A0A7J6AV02_AMEME|nr:hypothetical protein AMELA_G00098600 [Ameiurus melas]